MKSVQFEVLEMWRVNSTGYVLNSLMWYWEYLHNKLLSSGLMQQILKRQPKQNCYQINFNIGNT